MGKFENLIGEQWNNEIVEDIRLDFEGDIEVIVENSSNDGYDKIVYLNAENSTQYLFKLDENGIIESTWEE